MCEVNPLRVQRGITGYWMPYKAKFPNLQARIFEMVFPGGTSGKESTCQWRKCKRFNPWVGKIPWSRQWQPTAIFSPGNPMDRGAWRATVHGFAKSRTRLSVTAQAFSVLQILCTLRTWHTVSAQTLFKRTKLTDSLYQIGYENKSKSIC